MLVDFKKIPPMERYILMTQTIIPRPVAWMLTANAGSDGTVGSDETVGTVGSGESGMGGSGFNLAPFSYFNALSSEPPLVGISFTAKPSGGEKDTLLNIRRTGLFAAHIAPTRLLAELNESSAGLPYGESELSRIGLEVAAFGDFPLPRILGCPAAYGCVLAREIRLGPAQVLILGEVKFLHADDSVLETDAKGRSAIDAGKVDPIARLGAGNYAGLANFAKLKRPE